MLLDEADSLTEGAQQALRMIISNSNDTRFVLSCNDSSKLIAPIQSRCVLLKFKKLSDSEVRQSLSKIAQQ
jgi:replication factor C subunit 2/4